MDSEESPSVGIDRLEMYLRSLFFGRTDHMFSTFCRHGVVSILISLSAKMQEITRKYSYRIAIDMILKSDWSNVNPR